MSTSISLQLSFDDDEQLTGRNKRPPAETLMGNSKPSISRKREQLRARKNRSTDGQDFYEEVDELMSRNSFEYPEEQARYVRRWIDDNILLGGDSYNLDTFASLDSSSQSSLSDVDCPGNVVGIRGYPKLSGINSRAKFRSSFRQEQPNNERTCYNRLKFDYTRLKTQFRKLRNSFDHTLDKCKRIVKAKNQEVQLLRELAADRRRQESQTCEHEAQQRLGHVIGELEQRLRDKEELASKLLVQLESVSKTNRLELEAELESTRKKLAEIKSEPANQLVCSLRNENERLKSQIKVDSEQFQSLKDQYNMMELKLKSLMDDERCVNVVKNEEVAKLRIELCRFQVYQPKLEQILETERAIKLELQNRIGQLESEVSHLVEERDKLKAEMSKERTRSRQNESEELLSLQSELDRWRDKFQQMRKDKADADEIIRNYKAKFEQLDSRHERELETSNESKDGELRLLRHQLVKLESERNKISCESSSRDHQISQMRAENETLTRRIHELTRELEISKSCHEKRQSAVKRLEDEGGQAERLAVELKQSHLRYRQLRDETRVQSIEADRYRREVDQLKQRLSLQQIAFDELKQKKDKELSQLRVKLNFEQYQRQIALESIEKELRSSVRELEAMKVRFSGKRMVFVNKPSQNTNSQNTTTTTSTSSDLNSIVWLEKRKEPADDNQKHSQPNRVHFESWKSDRSRCSCCMGQKDPNATKSNCPKSHNRQPSSAIQNDQQSPKHWR